MGRWQHVWQHARKTRQWRGNVQGNIGISTHDNTHGNALATHMDSVMAMETCVPSRANNHDLVTQNDVSRALVASDKTGWRDLWKKAYANSLLPEISKTFSAIVWPLYQQTTSPLRFLSQCILHLQQGRGVVYIMRSC